MEINNYSLTVQSDKNVVVIPLEEYEALMETIEIQSNPELLRAIEVGLSDRREGRTISHKEVREKFDAED